jgi:hypothetical protein
VNREQTLEVSRSVCTGPNAAWKGIYRDMQHPQQAVLKWPARALEPAPVLVHNPAAEDATSSQAAIFINTVLLDTQGYYT